MLIYPCFEILQLSEIDDETVGVCFIAGEGEAYCPIVPVDHGTVPDVAVLAVGEWYIAVSFRAGEHI